MDKRSKLRAQANSPIPIDLETYLNWDTSDIIDGQVEYILEEVENSKERLEALINQGHDKDKAKELLEKEIREEVYTDQDLFEREYEDLVSNITGWMEALPGYTGNWRAEVKNFGWRNQSGYKEFKADNGRELLRQILPDTDCTYWIFKSQDGEALVLSNCHHDQSIPFTEWYTIRPVKEEE